MQWLGNMYNWLWFHSEFALTHVDRRPYTFIMRDFIFRHPRLAGILIGLWYAGLVLLLFHNALAAFLLGAASSLVLGHVVWGEKWLFREQENPTYLGD